MQSPPPKRTRSTPPSPQLSSTSATVAQPSTPAQRPGAQTSSGRLLALRALELWHSKSLPLERALEQTCQGTDERERTLAWELAFGVVRHRSLLDALLLPLLQKPLARLPEVLQDILRLGVYQLRASRTPARAIVHASVEHCRQVGMPWATGLVNGLLRRLDREPERLQLPPLPWPPDAPRAALLRDADRVGVSGSAQLRVLESDLPGLLEPLCLRHATPRYWVQAVVLERLKAADPALPGLEEMPGLLASTLEIPPLVLCANPQVNTREQLLERLTAAGLKATPGTLAPGSIHLQASGPIPALPGFQEGAFWVQDEASQLAASVLDAQSGETVLDACAAPGGKTFCLAAQVGPHGKVIATDSSFPRLQRVEESLVRLGLKQVTCQVKDWEQPGVPEGMPRTFDRVLIDAPCTGFGVLRRIPEIKWRRAEAEVTRYAQRQLSLLLALAGLVRPGGSLVYCVCSPLPAEGPQVVEAFLSEARSSDIGSWQRTDLRQFIQPELRGMGSRTGALHTWPHRHGCDAFFIARLTRLAP